MAPKIISCAILAFGVDSGTNMTVVIFLIVAKRAKEDAALPVEAAVITFVPNSTAFATHILEALSL